MRFLRNCSIAVKLAMSAGCALVLLGALSWSAQHALTLSATVQSRVSEAVAAERQIKDALLGAGEMRTLSRSLESRQTVTEVNKLAARAGKVAGDMRAVLEKLQATETDAAERGELAGALDALTGFATAVAHEAEQRKILIITRQKQLLEVRSTFEESLASFMDELTKGGVAAGGVDAVTGAVKAAVPPEILARAKTAFTAYQFAMARMQNTALLFLATGNRGAANEVRDAASDADARMQEVMASGLPAATVADAKVVQTFGAAIAHAAATVVDDTMHLNDFVDHTLDAAMLAMSQRLDAAARQVSARVEAAHDEAARAQHAAQTQILLIATGIALVLLLSAWVTSRAISRPIRAMTRVLQAMADGDTDVAIGHAGRRDEIGRMAAALEVLRGVAHDAFVKRGMIAQFPLGMMMADPADLSVTFVNPAAEQMLEPVREHLSAPPDQLAGQSLLQFYPDPEQRRAVFSDPANLPDRTRITIADETFELTTSAITDRSGRYVGPMVTWNRITGQVRLVQRFEQTVGQIAQTVGVRAETMKTTAHAMTEAADDAGARTAAVASASDVATANVGAVAASAEELAASVTEIARQVAELARIAGQAVNEAEAADRCVAGLSDAAGKIGEVVRLIGDIAGRTNLLALNATIEAARAGEAGKGFAVVASEVKTLATQTARATEEIGAQIAAMQGATGQAVETLRSIGETIQRMNEIATGIAGATEQQGAATREIARAVQQAAAGTAEVTGNIGHVAQAVDGTSSQAGQALAAASELAAQAETLRIEADRFMKAVQEAA